jgi:glutathione synthase/RimK-type ligase-like ATP-grasp enzyme
MKQPSILIITHSKDNVCIDHVSSSAVGLGANVIRLNVDLYPTECSLTTVFSDGKWETILSQNNQQISLHEIVAVWYRRGYNLAKGLTRVLEAEYLKAAVGEATQTLLGMIEGLDCFHLGRPSQYRRMDSKEEQLKCAVTCGLDIPATCISNDPVQVRQFIEKTGWPIVTKMQSAFAIYRGEEENVVFTSELNESHLAGLDSVKHCPMVFQQKIEKQLELRVTIIGRKIFAFSIDSQKEKNATVDWRKEGKKLIEDWQLYQLPASVENSLLQLMDYFQLHYGAIDLILTPDNRYYFLEINAAGEYFWLDQLCDNEISKAIAEMLVHPPITQTKLEQLAAKEEIQSW